MHFPGPTSPGFASSLVHQALLLALAGPSRSLCLLAMSAAFLSLSPLQSILYALLFLSSFFLLRFLRSAYPSNLPPGPKASLWGWGNHRHIIPKERPWLELERLGKAYRRGFFTVWTGPKPTIGEWWISFNTGCTQMKAEGRAESADGRADPCCSGPGSASFVPPRPQSFRVRESPPICSTKGPASTPVALDLS
jgi:hypothetical protein